MFFNLHWMHIMSDHTITIIISIAFSMALSCAMFGLMLLIFNNIVAALITFVAMYLMAECKPIMGRMAGAVEFTSGAAQRGFASLRARFAQ